MQAHGVLTWCGFGVCVRKKCEQGRGWDTCQGRKLQERLKGKIKSEKCGGDSTALGEERRAKGMVSRR